MIKVGEHITLDFLGVKKDYPPDFYEKIFYKISKFEDFGLIQKELEKRNIEIISSEFERLPKIRKSLNEEQKLKIDKLIDLIDEDDDVQNVYTDLE